MSFSENSQGELSQPKELNEDTFKHLFNKYYDNIYANLLAKTNSEDVASDLTQATFVKLWRYRSSFSADISPEIQLYRKAKQVLIDWLRREAHQRKIASEIEHLRQNAEPTKFELTDLLKKAIGQLPAMRQKVFVMSYVEGFSNKEIADRLKISVRTVEGHVQKALYQLRKSITWYSILIVIFVNQHINH